MVPFWKTGLYASLFDPANAVAFRENTFKLLPDPNIKRIIAHTRNIFIPVIFGLAFIRFRESKKLFNKIILIFIMAVGLLAAGISGARGPIAYLFLLIGILYLFEVGPGRGILILLGFLVIALLIAFVLTVLRRGELFTADFDRMLTFAFRIYRRAFLTPFESGLLHNEYAAMNGAWGPSVIGFPFKGYL